MYFPFILFSKVTGLLEQQFSVSSVCTSPGQKEKEEVKMGHVDTPVIMALGRLRQGDCPENQASLGYSETISQKT